MRIGEAARRSGFSIRTLRFYDRRGLLAPASRSAAGYRLYADADLERLAFIRQAKALGLTLDAVRALVRAVATSNGSAPDRVRAMLDERIAHVARQITTLTRLKDELARRRRRLRRPPHRGDRKRGFCACLNGSHRRP
jgi:DNA-binding transcriptional MerR regulator